MQQELREGEARAESAAEAAPEADGEGAAAGNAGVESVPGGSGAEAAPRGAARQGALPSTHEAESGVEPVHFTPGAETRWCAGCERPMPGPGSYRLIDGEPYCPACVPFYSAHALGAELASARYRQGAELANTSKASVGGHPRPSDTLEPADLAGNPACDCCGSPLTASAPFQQGFSLCQACLTSDRELALNVARARHRRKLEALRAALDPERKT